jgi:hypothetical protein
MKHEEERKEDLPALVELELYRDGEGLGERDSIMKVAKGSYKSSE